MEEDKSCSGLSLFEPFFQILHGFRSWIFIDNFIHYAPKILHRVDIWGIWGPACFLILAGFFCTMPGWPWLHVLAAHFGRTSCGDWNWTIFACLLLHSHFYSEGQASLLSLICCWCSNCQSKSVLEVKNVSQWDRGLSFHPIMIHFELFLTWYAGGTWLSWEPQTISFFGLGSWNKYLGHISEKRKSSHSSSVLGLCTA